MKEDPALEAKAACAEVLAGHFTTKMIPTLTNIDTSRKSESIDCVRDWTFLSPKFDCMVAMRDPITRFVSHYYHFIEKSNPKFSGKKISDCTIEELAELIHDHANNTMVEYLSNHLSQLQPGRQFTLNEKVYEAEHMLSSCVVVVLEDWAVSTELAEAAVPWLKGRLGDAESKNVAVRKNQHEKITDFAPEKAASLQMMLRGDIELYSKALDVYCEQLDQFDIDYTEQGLPQCNGNTAGTVPMNNHSPMKDSAMSQVKQVVSVKNVDHIVTAQKLDGTVHSLAVVGKSDKHDITFVKSVTYFGRGNPLNFWDQRFELFIDDDFRSYLNEGFNTITLLIPWGGVQTSVVPPVYNQLFLERIEYLLTKASEHGLRVIFRVSYPHSFDPTNVPHAGERCHHIMGDDTSTGIKEGWIDYMRKLNAIFSNEKFKETYHYSFFSWEDFFCLLSIAQSAPEKDRRALSEHLGFDKYVTEKFSSNELKSMFPDADFGEYPIPSWDVANGAFSAYIDFIDMKWWNLVEEGREVHPKLTMEVRVDIEGGIKPYDLHYDDKGPPRQGYYGGYMGAKKGSILSADEGVRNLEKVLVHSTDNGRSPLVLGQFNFQDNTPHMMKVMARISHDECNRYLELSAAVLKKYTMGYGLWAYKDYRQSEIFNGSFLSGLDGWVTRTGGSGKIMFQDSYLLLSGRSNQGDSKSFATVEQGVKQQPENSCDDGNNNMQLCFQYRMRGNLANDSDTRNSFHIVWDKKQLVDSIIANSSVWIEHCTRVPALEVHKFYTIGFSVQGTTSVNIDNVQVFCHTHSMHMHAVDNTFIQTCGKGIPVLNRLLGAGRKEESAKIFTTKEE